jgi:Holliday junction resolvase-like predicted endonuclease
MSPKEKRNALRAARLYLEMRGHKLLEQGWSSGKHKIALIASKNGVTEFVGISYAPENGITDVADSAREIEKLKQAHEAWIDENKFTGRTEVYVIEIYGDNYSILSFNEL